MRRLAFVGVIAALIASAAEPPYESARRKLDLIESRKAKPHSVFNFSPEEINAWAPIRVPDYVPKGLRNPRVELGEGTANGYALVDLLKMRDAQGFMAKMVEGERPVKISLRVESGGGRCTVFLTRVEISGITATGPVLDFLVKTFFVPMYPEAKINEPFELDYNIERIELHPAGVKVVMR